MAKYLNLEVLYGKIYPVTMIQQQEEHMEVPGRISESQIETAICQALTRNGHFVVKNKDQSAFRDGAYRKGSPWQIRGVSDLTVFLNDGITVWLEVKTPTGVQSPHQKAFEEKINSLGHYYFVVRSIGQAVTAIGSVLKLTRDTI